jgi:hypothetical protein
LNLKTPIAAALGCAAVLVVAPNAMASTHSRWYVTHHITPATGDKNRDHLPDAWEAKHGLSLRADQAARDQDGDSLDNLYEYLSYDNPRADDTDADGTGDAQEQTGDGDDLEAITEQQAHTNPEAGDTDYDGVGDQDEDYDGDGLDNAVEQETQSDAGYSDSDHDGITDADEDYDGDGVANLAEIEQGDDPGVDDQQ